jgi:acetolactate synthase-1/2/3 large subunit
MVAARWEGARVVFVSGCSRPPQRGRWAFQETGGGGNPLQSLYSSGTLFHYAAMIEDPTEIETALTRVATGLQQANGFVAHVGLPINIQSTPVARSYVPSVFTAHSGGGNDGALAEIVSQIADEQLVIWAGFGARAAAENIREFVELTQTPIMCSPRAKGVFPEHHPLYLGVTGLGGSKQLDEHLAHVRPDRVLVLGSRLGEMTSFWSESLIPPNGIVHIDVDPSVFGAAYPRARTVGIVGDVGACLRQVITGWPGSRPHRKELSFLKERSSHMRPHQGRRCVRPSYLMQVLQSIVVENSNAIVLTEAGNSFALGNHYLHFPEANRYRVSTGFGSMGHAAAGVIGASMGSGRKAVALVGDGSLLMLNEISTAVTYHTDAVWIVLNDSRYGMIAQGMESLGWTPFGTDFPEVDFVAIARAVGAAAVRVDSESELATAIATAMATRGPFLVDVVIDRREQAPSGRRNQSLLQQTSTVRAPQ